MVDVHIDGIELVPGVVVVHAVFVVYGALCTSIYHSDLRRRTRLYRSMPPVAFGIFFPFDDDTLPIVSVTGYAQYTIMTGGIGDQCLDVANSGRWLTHSNCRTVFATRRCCHTNLRQHRLGMGWLGYMEPLAWVPRLCSPRQGWHWLRRWFRGFEHCPSCRCRLRERKGTIQVSGVLNQRGRLFKDEIQNGLQTC